MSKVAITLFVLVATPVWWLWTLLYVSAHVALSAAITLIELWSMDVPRVRR